MTHVELVEGLRRHLALTMSLLHSFGEEALDVAYGWQLDATGDGTVVNGGEVSDPTGNAATAGRWICPQCKDAMEPPDLGTLAICAKCRKLPVFVSGNARDKTYKRLKASFEALDNDLRELNAVMSLASLDCGEEAQRRLDKAQAQAHKVEICACIHCDDMAESNHRHCLPCANWLAERPHMRQVPSDVIRKRVNRRKELERLRVPAENHVAG